MLGLHESRNFDLFVRFLTQPDQEAWAKYAAVNAIALPSTAMVSESVTDNLRAMVLNEGDAALPTGGGDLFAGVFERKHSDEGWMLRLCTIASKEAAMKGAPEGIECVARFFDDEATASKAGFKAAWIGFLRAFNVFQFLPRSWFVTSRGLEENAYAALTEAIGRKPEAKPVVDDPSLAELMDLSAPEVRSLLRLISH